MSMAAISGASFPPLQGGSAQGQQVNKLDKAAQAFEGIMIGTLWKSLQNDPLFAADDADPGSGTMGSLGLQAVSTAIASRGGLGLAKMIEKQLTPAIQGASGSENSGKSLKPNSPNADKLDVEVLP